MHNVKLRALSDGDELVSTRIIVVENDSPIPCVVVQFGPDYPSLSELFSRIEGVRLEIMHADVGGYLMSIEANDFASMHLATNEEGQQFLEYLRKRDKEWVLVAVAEDTTMIFMNSRGLATGQFTIPRDTFVRTVTS